MQGNSKRTRTTNVLDPLLVFVSARAMRETINAVNVEEGVTSMVHIPPNNTELAIVHYTGTGMSFFATMIPNVDTGPIVVERVSGVCDQLGHTARVMLLIPSAMREQINPAELPPSHYLIRNIPEFEECLNVQLSPEQHRQIARRVFETRQHRRRVVQVPLLSILGALANAGVGMVPAETRTPLNSEWEQKLATQPEAANEDAACVICLTAEPTIMLAPCQHQCVCDVCAKELLERDSQAKKCPMCRADIQDIFHPIK